MATHEAEATEDMRLTILVLAADMLSAYPRHSPLQSCTLITADRLLASACSGDSDQRTTSKLSTYLYITCI